MEAPARVLFIRARSRRVLHQWPFVVPQSVHLTDAQSSTPTKDQKTKDQKTKDQKTKDQKTKDQKTKDQKRKIKKRLQKGEKPL